MSGRPRHGTYDQERGYFMTTLHAQIDILKDNYAGNRQMSINSLGNLLKRMTALRMAGQTKNLRDNHIWTEKCNKLNLKIINWREDLIKDPKCTRTVANDIETTMIFLDFCLPTDMYNRTDLQYWIGSRDSDDSRRGDRSGAPSPEILPRQDRD